MTATQYASVDAEELPKVNSFAKELVNWLILATILLFIIYGILFLVYEIALDLTHVRWAFIGFLIGCAIDVVTYWMSTYVVQDSSGEVSSLLYIVLAAQMVTGIYFLIAPIIVLCTFSIHPSISVTKNDKLKSKDTPAQDYEDQFYHTFDDYVAGNPCDSSKGASDYAWQCDYERSVRVAAWCMLIPVLPKFLFCYLISRILKKRRRHARN